MLVQRLLQLVGHAGVAVLGPLDEIGRLLGKHREPAHLSEGQVPCQREGPSLRLEARQRIRVARLDIFGNAFPVEVGGLLERDEFFRHHVEEAARQDVRRAESFQEEQEGHVVQELEYHPRAVHALLQPAPGVERIVVLDVVEHPPEEVPVKPGVAQGFDQEDLVPVEQQWHPLLRALGHDPVGGVVDVQEGRHGHADEIFPDVGHLGRQQLVVIDGPAQHGQLRKRVQRHQLVLRPERLL
mmetsp:Transcript_26158/g.54405  ORF Transcript_26158/g.54405 Transcript_26158/m.54405 type:complete len:241 (-) Transcript_26158:902-1624(-)